MDKKQYIMIGSKILSKDIFRDVLRPLNNLTFKPTGGLWASEYKQYTISSWFDYMRNDSGLLYSGKIYNASLFTLKDTAKILLIDSEEKLKNTLQKYPSYSHLLNNHQISNQSINFESLSKDYDGLYLDLNKLFIYSNPIFGEWHVSTLLLFNLDVIDNYQSITIGFHSPSNFDYPYFKEIENKTIEKKTPYYEELYTYIELIFNELINKKENFIDYNEYFSYLIEATKTSIQFGLKFKMELATKTRNYLQNQNINTDEYTIIRNIATNVLSNYFKNNIEAEKNIPKTKTKKFLEYPIDENQN